MSKENYKYLSANILDASDLSGLKYSKSTVRKAGIVLKQKDISDDERDDAMFVLSNYRASHKAPLLYVTSILFDESILVDRDVIVAKRFKRTPSIVKKLTNFSSMDLDRMQDIAGCRAIFSNKKKLEKVRRVLVKKNMNFRIKNYIDKPKKDGYRGVHLICTCDNPKSSYKFFVEIQLRTKIQHSWATAIEIVDLLTNQQLKSNQQLKTGIVKDEWLDFFKIIADSFEKLDNNEKISFDLLKQSIKLIKKMKIHEKFSAFAQSLKFIESQNYEIDIGYNLILIDLKEEKIEVESYHKHDFDKAVKNYLDAEREASMSKNLVTALVSTESITNLKDAYPNYFADSAYFLEHISQLEFLYESNKIGFFDKLINQLSNFEDKSTRERNLN